MSCAVCCILKRGCSFSFFLRYAAAAFPVNGTAEMKSTDEDKEGEQKETKTEKGTGGGGKKEASFMNVVSTSSSSSASPRPIQSPLHMAGLQELMEKVRHQVIQTGFIATRNAYQLV